MYGGLAFVIRVYPNKSKTLLLDRDKGKFEIYKRSRLPIYNGLLVKYQPDGKLINIVETLPSGIKFDKAQLDFYHLILEFCLNFIPFGLHSPEIFDLIYFVYFSFNLFKDPASKKALIYKMFYLLGLGADSYKFKRLVYLLPIPIDIVAQQEIDLEVEKELNAFIRESLDLNPAVYKFNTRHFFKEVGVL